MQLGHTLHANGTAQQSPDRIEIEAVPLEWTDTVDEARDMGAVAIGAQGIGRLESP